MPELSVNMPMSGDSARVWHIWGTCSRSWGHLQTLHCAPQLHQSQPLKIIHKKGPNRDDATLLSPKSNANWNIQNLNHNFTADLLIWSQHTVIAPESCVLYLEIAICEMSCYFRRAWLGNTGLTWTSCLQDTHHRPWYNRAPLTTVLCCDGPEQLAVF